MPISGVMMSLTSVWTTPVNAAPMTMPTARSTTLPRRMNFLKQPSSLPNPDANWDQPDRAASIAIWRLLSIQVESGSSPAGA